MDQSPSTDPKKTTLIILTSVFPYGIGEAFLESEIGYLTAAFKNVHVVAKDIKGAPARYTAPNFSSSRLNPESSIGEIIVGVLLLLARMPRALRYLFGEISYLGSRKRNVTMSVLSTMLVDLIKALIIAREANGYLRKNKITGPVMVYAYWYTSLALAATLVRPGADNIRRISRAHHADIYEDQSSTNYLSFRSVIVQHLDALFSISAHGVNYLSGILPSALHHKLMISRLGTVDHGLTPGKQNNTCVVVSCSFIKNIKRVHLIVEALSLLPGIPVFWIHFGDGPLRSEIESLAAAKLAGKNIQFKFFGEFQNPQLLEFYRTTFVDLLINTSSSEGIPVSIMEAQSFGVPAVAMDVGGVSEIVTADTGILLPPDATVNQISEAIQELMRRASAKPLRDSTRMFWHNHYNAAINFPHFLEQIGRL